MRTNRPAYGSRPATDRHRQGRWARRATRLAVTTLAALVLLGLVAGPAAAATVEQVAAALQKNPVYWESGAEDISAQRLRRQVAEADPPIFIAILPDTALQDYGSIFGLAKEIVMRVGRDGTYMVISGTRWYAGGVRTLPAGRANTLAEQAFQNHADDPQAALLQWVDEVAAEAKTASAAAGQDDTAAAGQSGGDTGGGGGGGGVLAGVAVVALLVGGGALILGSRRRRRREAERQRELAEVKTVAQEDLVALGEDIRALDLDTSMPDADPEAVRHYTEAVDHYQRAATIFDGAKRTEDLAPMSAALEAGRFSMASTKAILEGRPPPEHRPPCFFDPRHGPSVEDVEWAPPDGAPRMVPACAADAQRIRDGLEPESRQVLAGAGGRMTPYWNAPGYYGPWAGGYFGGFPMGGLFTGLLLGSFLGGGWGGYPVYAGGGDGGGGEGDAGGSDAGGSDAG
ncbi:MAG TPA: hypothetical protein VK942_17270, partial [Actinomycetes bacterium]|nr:hypothetical protein [Actinomycetes bacterium]